MQQTIYPLRGQFNHIDFWIFDLDNTLYPASCRLFEQIERRMGLFVQDFLKLETEAEAKIIQKKYFEEYGTTLNGLMQVNNVDPHDYLNYCHDIDYSPVQFSPRLDKALAQLPGQKLVFTNGDRYHSERVLNRLGVTHHFSGYYDIIDADFIPKPEKKPYKAFCEQFNIDPTKAAFFEDSARNLKTGHNLGMTTIHVLTDCEWAKAPEEADFIHHTCQELEFFLEVILKSLKSSV